MDKADANTLGISWHDSQWIPILNPANILEYFSERSNPFYDRTCNNEVIKMQHLHSDHLLNMTGIEFTLLHAQEPILYIVRKQNRHGPNHVTPLADYYIIAGVVYQGPDLASIVNSRVLNTLFHLQSAFSETHSFSRYHPSKGYWWEFKENESTGKEKHTGKEESTKDEPSSLFQRTRVDLLLENLTKKYPPQIARHQTHDAKEAANVEVKEESASDKASMKPPAEKKSKLR